MSKKITNRATDYSQWYHDIVQFAELADYSPVRGCMVIRPNGYAIWERIQARLDQLFKETGHRNLYFPLFIPESFLKKEAEHVEGFAPECAVVTHGGGKQLEEPLVVRPTSETMIWHMYKKWISSYRDLPLLYNQWANVVRWEMRTRLFLRTTEFLWQEGHTAHETEHDARQEALRMLEIYRTFAEETLAIPVITGTKTANERFAGAVDTYSIEALMQDGKALQMGTSHYLGENFSRAFDVQFQNREGDLSYVHATSWGSSTRMIGGLIMCHSDDQGLVLPPEVADTQVVIVPIWRSEEDKSLIREAVAKIKASLKRSYGTHFDDREECSPGFKFNEWELKGIPIRMEIGPRDLKKGEVVLVRRDTGQKEGVPIEGLNTRIDELLRAIQLNLLERARKRQADQTHRVDHYADFEGTGYFIAHWCGERDCEQLIAQETKVTIRNIPLATEPEKGQCIRCERPSTQRVLFAKAY